MSKVAITIAERPNGSGKWEVLDGPSGDVQGQRDLVDDLVSECGVGNNKVLVLTQYGTSKRKKIALPEGELAGLVKKVRGTLAKMRKDAVKKAVAARKKAEKDAEKPVEPAKPEKPDGAE